MKPNVILLFILISHFLAINCHAQTCPTYGTAKGEREKELNIRKNYSAQVPKVAVDTLKLDLLITTSNDPDINNFKEGTYVAVEGYLVSFKEEGAESCNCKLANAEQKTGDVHIYLGLTPHAEKKECIVVEITPAFKALHPNYQSLLKNGTKVRVFGYLLYDFMHERNAVNTCNDCAEAWRKTCWEIHPVTQIVAL